MFWGLVNGVKSILHKTNKCNCNCDKTKKVVEVVNNISNEDNYNIDELLKQFEINNIKISL